MTELLNSWISLQFLWLVMYNMGLSDCCSAQRVAYEQQLLCQSKSCSWGQAQLSNSS